ncbi:hypothetical protein P3S68_008069 [Capsicum galapagoense]
MLVMRMVLFLIIQENKKGLELLKTAIDKAGYTGKVVIGMDVAASEFYVKDKTYDLNFKERIRIAEEELLSSRERCIWLRWCHDCTKGLAPLS